MENLPNRINTRRRGKVWPKVLSNVFHGIYPYAIDAVIPNKCLDPVVVSADDFILLRIHVGQRELIISKPALLNLGLVAIVRDQAR
jgi:hypothetical protein